MHLVPAIVITSMLVGLTACSNRAVYENLQLHQRNQCLKQDPATNQKCMARTEQAFEEYQRERQALLDKER